MRWTLNVVVATFLKLTKASEYTGQCWRGTAATLCADAGLCDSEIQNVTGHKSVSALQVYKANSETQKLKVSNALAMCSSSSSSAEIRKPAHSDARTSRSRDININITGSSNAVHLSFYKDVDESDDSK